MKKISKGFTLIELLVVIAIISILAGILMVSFTGPQAQARDAQRRSDIKQYQTALENFANANNGLYPSSDTNAWDIAESTVCDDLGMSACPTDPTNDVTHVYTFRSNNIGGWATFYVIYTQLENNDNYFIVCSDGRSGEAAAAPVSPDCPSSLD